MEDDKRRQLINEVTGIAFLAVAILLFISLVTFQPRDTSDILDKLGMLWARPGTIGNYAGLVGAGLAFVLFWGLGYVAYFTPLLALVCAVGRFRHQDSQPVGWIKLTGSLLFLLSLCVLMNMIGSDVAGGMIGRFFSRMVFLPVLNVWGSYLVSFTLLSIGLLLTTELTLNKTLDWGKQLWVYIPSLFPEKDDTPARHSRRRKPAAPDEPEAEYPISLPVPDKTDIKGGLKLPPFSQLLDSPKPVNRDEALQNHQENSAILEAKLSDFGVEGKVKDFFPGPVVTRYELEPAPGVKINQIVNLSDDLALAMKAASVRIVAPVPGKAVVGIEIPNPKRETIYLKEIVQSDAFQQAKSKLTLALGKDISGAPYVTDLAAMPHLLIAGATGSGKSVTLNSIICSILFKATKDEVRLIMLDPKMLELGMYNGIPHLLIPVVTDAKQAAKALFRALQEMEYRYCLMADKGVRNIDQYNAWLEQHKNDRQPGEGEEENKPLPYLVIVIDEFADLIMVASKDVEGIITRLAQMSRAVGIHLIIATQRPSVDVITGLIKANFPSRISFKVSSKTDSRTIIDTIGSEKLLGKGDMLFIGPGSADLVRIHGTLVTEKEVKRVVDYLCQQGPPQYDNSFLADTGEDGEPVAGGGSGDEYDEIYDQAVDYTIKRGSISISNLQRKFKVGYNRAARIVEIMERDGVVGPSIGGKPRKVLIGGDKNG